MNDLIPLHSLVNVPTSGFVLFFFNDTATTEIYTLSLHDALPISVEQATPLARWGGEIEIAKAVIALLDGEDRKSTRLNSSHSQISYAVFCLKKKKQIAMRTRTSLPVTNAPPSLRSGVPCACCAFR